MAKTGFQGARQEDWTPDALVQGGGNVWRPFTQMATEAPPLPVAATHGVRIRLEDGRELIDGMASWWTACHGYNHPHITGAIAGQLEIMPHVMFGGLCHEAATTLARRLARMLPGDLDHVFFCDSGSVAVEIALKMAIQFWINHGVRGRTKFAAFRHGYHGDTMGAMAVSDTEDGMHQVFAGALAENFILDLPRTKAELAAFDSFLGRNRDVLAGVIMEPLVQAAGGMKFHDADTLAAIFAACRRHDVLFLADEVATGFGRTGSMFGCDQAGIAPDILCLSKALTGGTIGLGATVANARVYDAFLGDDLGRALMHGPTFMANPLACAAANASLDLFEAEPRLQEVKAIEARLADALAPCRGIEAVRDVRALGAIGVIELTKMRDLEWLRRRFVELGVWLRPFGDMVYVMPAFTIGADDLGRITDAMVQVVGEWSRRG
ncbi:MAG: adenosylmethionine--8-amino-7-oxononanoate transaminase [Alphaproteobacteria bacterium]